MAYDFEQRVANERGEGRRRAWLKWLLAAGALAYPIAEIIHAAYGDETWSLALSGWLLVVAMVGWLASWSSPFNRDIFRTAFGKQSQLDERERAEMARVQSQAYTVVIALAAIGLIYSSFAASRGWWLPATADDWYEFMLMGLFFLTALPVLIAEWTIPLPPREDIA